MKFILALLALASPAFADSAMTVTAQTEHGETITLIVTSSDPDFCTKWKSTSPARNLGSANLTAKIYRKRFAIGADALIRELGSARILSNTCGGNEE